jgi:hypothetical protein
VTRRGATFLARIGRSGRRGIILLSVAWCVLILGLLLAARVAREELAFRVDRAAQSGLDLALAVHSAESMFQAGLVADAKLQAETSYDAPADAWGWGRLKEKFGEDLTKSYPDVELLVKIEDEGSKINPAKAPPETLDALLRNLGWPESQSRDLAAMIQKLGKPEQGGGAAASAQSAPVAGKQAFLDLRKLLAIPNFSEELLYGEDANFNGILDPNENDGNESAPPDDRNGQLRPGLLDFLSVWGDGKVNPNLASLEILMTVPGMSKKIATEIVNRRVGTDGVAGNSDDHVFKKPEDIKKLNAVSKYVEFEYTKIQPCLRMTTELFQIRICATSKRTGQTLRRQSVVRRKKTKITLISQREDNGI